MGLAAFAEDALLALHRFVGVSMIDPWVCHAYGCRNVHAKNKWATHQAQTKGWFFQKDGKAYCPEHTPDWVKSWREKHQPRLSEDK